MSDEELAFLVTTRGDQLAEEAQHALRKVIQRRDQKSFARELNATSADVKAQEHQARVEVEQTAASARQARTFLHYFSAGLVLLGLIVGFVMQIEGGWFLVIAGVGASVTYELKLLLWRFVTALFSQN